MAARSLNTCFAALPAATIGITAVTDGVTHIVKQAFRFFTKRSQVYRDQMHRKSKIDRKTTDMLSKIPRPKFPTLQPVNSTILMLVPDFISELQQKLNVRNSLNLSLVLRQLAHLVKIADPIKTHRDNRYWTYQTLRELQQNAFPFWHYSTVNRTLKKLEESELIVTGVYNTWSADRTKWYSISYDRLTDFESVEVVMDEERQRPYLYFTGDSYRIYPDLAAEIGLHESIVLLQIQYLIRIQNAVENGRYFASQRTSQLRKVFRFLSESEMNRTIAKLVEEDFITVDRHVNKVTGEHSRIFALNELRLARLKSVRLNYNQ